MAILGQGSRDRGFGEFELEGPWGKLLLRFLFPASSEVKSSLYGGSELFRTAGFVENLMKHAGLQSLGPSEFEIRVPGE